MPRNKYPEITIEKILAAAQKLFLEKGYDETTIQDIVNELGGMTKGAIYHHFKSKDDIFVALSEKMFSANNPFAIVKNRKDLNGLQKIREAIRLSNSNEVHAELARQGIPILKNPRMLAVAIEGSRTQISPLLTELLEEGNRDGSINTKYPSELAEVFQLLTDIWLTPSIFPATAEEMYRKILFLKEMLDNMGVPLFDEAILNAAKHAFEKI